MVAVVTFIIFYLQNYWNSQNKLFWYERRTDLPSWDVQLWNVFPLVEMIFLGMFILCSRIRYSLNLWARLQPAALVFFFENCSQMSEAIHTNWLLSIWIRQQPRRPYLQLWNPAQYVSWFLALIYFPWCFYLLLPSYLTLDKGDLFF